MQLLSRPKITVRTTISRKWIFVPEPSLKPRKVAKTKKLLKLTIDTGIDKRTVVSGIAEYYNPEEIIGQQVSILVNLEPRELKGIMSQGMILMAQDADGSLKFVTPTTPVKNGSEIK